MSRRQREQQTSSDSPTISGPQLSALSAAVAGAVTEALQRSRPPVPVQQQRNALPATPTASPITSGSAVRHRALKSFGGLLLSLPPAHSEEACTKSGQVFLFQPRAWV